MNKLTAKEFTALKLAVYDELTQDAHLTALDCRVWWRIVAHMNQKHGWTAWPSYPRIGRQVGCHADSVRRSVGRLCAIGYLSRASHRGVGKSCSYALKTENRTVGSGVADADESDRTVGSDTPCPSVRSPRTVGSANIPLGISPYENSLRGADAISPSRGEGARSLNAAEVAAERLRREREAKVWSPPGNRGAGGNGGMVCNGQTVAGTLASTRAAGGDQQGDVNGQ